ncbi:hypothetical protein COLO4_12061 [Corchorus olitorius]|uniref:Uncharacterized protein n=1 Tax=Corchorus olitorius TaxID=93759 RepID=A0A1R3K299_9ROSI|nr:hypothetical protein COLO4_12061 [Corchorus olitorius]
MRLALPNTLQQIPVCDSALHHRALLTAVAPSLPQSSSYCDSNLFTVELLYCGGSHFHRRALLTAVEPSLPQSSPYKALPP